MRALAMAAAVVATLLVGCSKPAAYQNFSDERTEARLIKPPPPPGAPKAEDATATPDAAPTPIAQPSAPMLAYAYAYGVEAPPARIVDLVAKHQRACAAAGAAVCQMTGSTMETQGRDQIHATLALRATPAWLAGFRAGLARDAQGAGGRVIQANVTSEDLSRQVTDTQAAIRARTTLRDRLQAILAGRPGRVADLVEAETALARVQGELDATQSEMAMMRQRLDTAAITIDYQSAGVLTPDNTWSPLTAAIDRFVATFIGALAMLITAVAALAPWLAVIGGGLWAFRGPLRRVKWPWKRRGAGAP